MTQKEKIQNLDGTIKFLFEKEGRSKSYISKLLEVDRATLTKYINEKMYKQANISRLTPSNQKFSNKNKNLIISRLMNDVPVTKISIELNVGMDYLRNIIEKTEDIKRIYDEYLIRIKNKASINKEKLIESSSRNYKFEDLEGEIWKEILGYEGYYVSNKGRIKHYVKTHKICHLMSQTPNSRNGRMYVGMNNNNLQVARLVGFAFVDGFSEYNNTIEHIDNDVSNNCSLNLRWVSQSENNKEAYKKGRQKSVAYGKNGKFKKIKLNDKYEFKTIKSMALFLGVSESQAHRYISGETKTENKIELIY